MVRAISYIHSADVKRARPFYEGVLGLTVDHADDDVIHGRLGDHAVRIITIDGHKPSTMSVFGVSTPDIGAYLASLKDKGIIAERWLRDQDISGVWTGPDGEKIAWFKDPDGNVLSVVEQRD